MAAVGSFTFVLHSHLPYCRRAGRWPHGEEWIHEAASECYLPLLDVLRRLHKERVPIRLTIGITPVLAEQLGDRLVLENMVSFMSERRDAAAKDMTRFASEPERAIIAAWYRDRYDTLLRLFHDELHGDLLGGFKQLADAGVVGLATSAATHGYLPLMSRDSTIRAQIGTGARAYRRLFGRDPRAIWLPECAYRPAYRETTPAGERERPGIETFLAKEGLKIFFVETHTIEGGRPVGKAAGDAVGYPEIARRWVVPLTENAPTRQTTFQPYWVTQPEVAALGRNNRTGMQVWSSHSGYPGDKVYREFHKRDDTSGLHYWSVTGPRVDLKDKVLWSPAAAFAQTRAHADHFANLVARELVEYQKTSGTHGIISAAFDTELFGHWWFEGVDWLGEVLRRLAAKPEVELTTAPRYMEEHPPETVSNLPESSWGEGGGHFVWDNERTKWMWPIIHRAEERIEAIAARHAGAVGPMALLAKQAAREALLLESSDWPFLVTTGQANEYAIERFNSHVERFSKLCDRIEANDLSPESIRLAEEYYELDNVFPDIDLALFAPR